METRYLARLIRIVVARTDSRRWGPPPEKHRSEIVAGGKRLLWRLHSETAATIAKIDRRLFYDLRARVRGALLPLLSPKKLALPPLRDDLSRYWALFRHSSASFEEIVRPFVHEFRWPLAVVYNKYFESVDAELYYCVVRRSRPKRVVEIGSGNSAWFAREALHANGFGEHTVIDPSPRTILPEGTIHLRSLVQDVPLSFFQHLSAGDILFVDSSHTTDEARYQVNQLLPSLDSGVVIHYHDILFPFAVWHLDDRNKYGEPDVLLEFLRENSESFEIMTSGPFVFYERPDLIRQLVPSAKHDPLRVPHSLWLRKVAR